MKTPILLSLMLVFACQSVFALSSVKKSLLVYSNRYAFQGAKDGLIPAGENVADYLESLNKGSALFAAKYSCDVKFAQTILTTANEIVRLDMLYDVSNCQANGQVE